MRKFIVFLFGFLLIVALSFILPRHYNVPYPMPIGPKLAPSPRQSYRQDIEAQRSEIVLLGDSMLERGVDGDYLADELDRSVYNLGIHGLPSAGIYLIIRHNIITAEPPPKVLIIFFRDTIMTTPAFRVSGSYYTNILYENTSPDEPLLMQYSFIEPMNPVERLAEQYFPLYGQRLNLRGSFDHRLRYTATKLVLDCDSECSDSALDNVFNANKMEPSILGDAAATAESYLYTPENLDFNANIEHSYLPEIIRLTHERGIRLILVRFKTLTFPNAASQPEGLKNYINNLRAYLTDNNVTLMDYSNDARILDNFYADPWHMTAQGKAIFTRYFATDLQSILDGTP